jgi:polysaccharide export outer membrane protein
MHKRIVFTLSWGMVLLSLAVWFNGMVGLAEDKPVPATQPAAENAQPSGQADADRPHFQPRDWRYRVRPGDVLDLNFSYSAEFNQTVTVQPDGHVTLRELGDMKVDGQTLPELRQKLVSAYSKILHDPVITIDLKDFEKPYFTAGGEVGKPGKYELRGPTTVAEALAIAGGYTTSAKHSQVILFRRVDENWVEAKKLDVKKMFNTADLREDLDVRPGDMVFVPKNLISKLDRFISRVSMGMYVGPQNW